VRKGSLSQGSFPNPCHKAYSMAKPRAYFRGLCHAFPSVYLLVKQSRARTAAAASSLAILVDREADFELV